MTLTLIRRRVSLAAGVLALVTGAVGCIDNGARGSADAGKGPAKIHIVTGDSIQWGSVPPGSLVDTVLITNIGGDTLRISDVRPSCGCTTAPIDKNVLLPGDTAHVVVTMDAKDKSGAVMKHLTITSNDSTAPTRNINLMATILRDVAIEPTLFPMVTTKKAGEEGTTSVYVKNTGTAPLMIGPPRFKTPPAMVASFDMTQAVQVQPGDSTPVNVNVRTIQTSTAVGTVVIPTSSKLMPELELTITASVNPNM